MTFSVLKLENQKEISRLFENLKVDPYGTRIMLPKSVNYLIRINSISGIAASILKQQMLSLGGDAALPREVLTGKLKLTDCILIGNLNHFHSLKEKLSRQPFGLKQLGSELSKTIKNYHRENFDIVLKNKTLKLGPKPKIMGILNVTADSFSGDGILGRINPASIKDLAAVVDYIQEMADNGADIIDIGGESSRPQAKPVSLKEELNRTIPIIKAAVKKIKVPISIDTYKPEVARCAVENGADIVNDITGLRNKKMVEVVKRCGCGVVVMHMKGNPQNMQERPEYEDVVYEIKSYFEDVINKAVIAGVDSEKIIIDPGIGISFGKTVGHNLEILKRLNEFKVLGRPILVGTSRKSFIGKILDAQPKGRIMGTIATCLAAVNNGASIVRVHDIQEVKQAFKVWNSVKNGSMS